MYRLPNLSKIICVWGAILLMMYVTSLVQISVMNFIQKNCNFMFIQYRLKLCVIYQFRLVNFLWGHNSLFKQKFCRLVVISLALLVFYYGWVFHMPEFHVKYWYICVIVDETFTTCGSSIYSSVSRCWYLTMNNVYVRKNN